MDKIKHIKVLVCGGRNYTNREHLNQRLNDFEAWLYTQDANLVTLIHGGARGADLLSGEWAKSKSIDVQVFPAEWDKYGRSAGFKRNTQMLAEDPDYVLAFEGGRGTQMMCKIARDKGTPTFNL